MESKKKTFDAVAWVRKVRDDHYEQTKDMTPADRLAFDRERGSRAQEKFEQRAKDLSSTTPNK